MVLYRYIQNGSHKYFKTKADSKQLSAHYYTCINVCISIVSVVVHIAPSFNLGMGGGGGGGGIWHLLEIKERVKSCNYTTVYNGRMDFR